MFEMSNKIAENAINTAKTWVECKTHHGETNFKFCIQKAQEALARSKNSKINDRLLEIIKTGEISFGKKLEEMIIHQQFIAKLHILDHPDSEMQDWSRGVLYE